MRKKLFLVFGTSLVFITAIILVGLGHMLWMKNSSIKVYEDAVVEAQSLFKLKTGLEQVRRQTLLVLLEEKHSGSLEEIDSIRKTTRSVDDTMDLMLSGRGYNDPHITEKLRELQIIWNSFKKTRDESIIPKISNGKKDEAKKLAMGVQDERFRDFISIVDGLIERSNREAQEIQTLVTATFSKAILLYAAISVTGFAVAVSLIFYFSRGIAWRLGRMMENIGLFNSGKPVLDLKMAGKDEMGTLEDALGRLFKQIYEDRISQDQYMEIMAWESTEKEKKRLELKKSEEKFRGLIETTGDWVWEIDSKGVYTYSSPRVTEILGYTPEEVLGRTPFDLMPDDEAQRVSAVFYGILLKKEPFTNLENTNLHKDGRAVVLETSAQPFFDTEGNLLGYRGIDRDITQRKAAEEEKIRMQANLVQTEKMASIGQLGAGVAHEINNPVGFVRSNLNTLSEYIESFKWLIGLYVELSTALETGEFEAAAAFRDEIEKYKKEINLDFAINDTIQLLAESKDGLSRISSIVKGLKDFSHAGGGDLSRHDLAKCVEDAIMISLHEVKNSAELIKDFGEVPPVLCRPQQLTQVFLNMILNAAQAMRGRGIIHVRTYSLKGYAVAEVIDNGPGMDEVILKKIFDPFFTTKPVGKGTGLGLSIAYGIIKEHNGTIEAESRPGYGTTFRIKLPIAETAASAA